MQNLNTKLATYPDIIERNRNNISVVEGVSVELVNFSQPHHIKFRKYTKDYAKMADRPYVVVATGRSYATLANAVRALYKNGFAPL